MCSIMLCYINYLFFSSLIIIQCETLLTIIFRTIIVTKSCEKFYDLNFFLEDINKTIATLPCTVELRTYSFKPKTGWFQLTSRCPNDNYIR